MFIARFFLESRDYVVNDYDNMVKKVTAKDLKAIAKKYFNLNNYVSVTLRPEDGAVGTAD